MIFTGSGNQLLSHPFAQQAIAVANGQLKQLDRQLSQPPAWNNLEAQTKIPRFTVSLASVNPLRSAFSSMVGSRHNMQLTPLGLHLQVRGLLIRAEATHDAL